MTLTVPELKTHLDINQSESQKLDRQIKDLQEKKLYHDTIVSSLTEDLNERELDFA